MFSEVSQFLTDFSLVFLIKKPCISNTIKFPWKIRTKIFIQCFFHEYRYILGTVEPG